MIRLPVSINQLLNNCGACCIGSEISVPVESQTYIILCQFKLEGYVFIVSRIFWKHVNGESCLLEETEKKEKVYKIIFTLVTLRTRSCKGLLFMSL